MQRGFRFIPQESCVFLSLMRIYTNKLNKQPLQTSCVPTFLLANKASTRQLLSHPRPPINFEEGAAFCPICLLPLPLYFSGKCMRGRSWKYCTRTKRIMAGHLESYTSETRPRALCGGVCASFPHVDGCIYELLAPPFLHLPLVHMLLLTHPRALDWAAAMILACSRPPA